MQKATMTLNLSHSEMAVIESLASEMDVSKTLVIRQALRLYQLVHVRAKAGETLHFSGDKDRAVLFLGLAFPSKGEGE